MKDNILTETRKLLDENKVKKEDNHEIVFTLEQKIDRKKEDLKNINYYFKYFKENRRRYSGLFIYLLEM